MTDAHWWALFAALAFLLCDDSRESSAKGLALVLLAYLLIANIDTQCFLLGDLVK